MKVGINGMGRIGRLALRAALGAAERPLDDPRGGNRLEVVHLNESRAARPPPRTCWSSTACRAAGAPDIRRGRRRACASTTAAGFSVARLGSETIPWGDLGVDVVLECTGKFLTPETLQGHLDRGAKRVIVAAPVKVGDVLNIVVGVNHQLYDPAKNRIVTAASCTTNCLAPVVKVVHEALGIRHGQITTIHDPTNTNLVVDAPHKDLRRARSAMLSLAPTTTGSATAIALIYPELKGKLNGHAVRAPVLNASLTDCVFELQRETTAEEVNALFAGCIGGRWPASWATRSGPWSAPTTPATRAAPSSMRLSTMVTDGTLLEGLRLVRQRDGLCLPHGRPGLPHARSWVSEMPMKARHAQLRHRHRAYWGFTLTDGALRMLVLLHFYRLGYSPFTLAFLFLLYEAAGVRGQPDRRLAGHALRHHAHADGGAGDADRRLPAARRNSPEWSAAMSVAWVVLAQGICGVAKDLTKTASKSAIKVTDGAGPREGLGPAVQVGGLVHRQQERHEGRGLLPGRPAAGGAGLSRQALWAMAALLALVLAGVVTSLPPMMGKSKASKSAKELFAKNARHQCCWPPRAWCCSARATSGSWSACRCFCIRRAGPSPWWAAFWRLDHWLWSGAGRGAQCLRPWCGAATTG
jgi:glyceraldehyde 3-phosphate dehydrogenase